MENGQCKMDVTVQSPDKLEFVGEKFQMGNGKWEIELAEGS